MLSKKRLGASWLKLMLVVLFLSPLIGTGMAGASDNQMLAAASNYVKANSVAGLTFDLKLLKQVNNYALLQVTPNGKWAGQLDTVQVIVQKINGQWVGQNMGSSFPDEGQIVPELFK